MKKSARSIMAALGLLIVFSVACGKGGDAAADKYVEVKETAARYVSLVETCAGEIEAAMEGGAVAAALNTMSYGLEPVARKLIFLGKQFPELNDPSGVPAELKPFKDKMDAVQPALKAAIKKANTFASDPVVQLALGRYAEIQKILE